MPSTSFSVDISVTERGRKVPQYRIDTDLDGEISLAELTQFMKATLILVAHDVLTEEQANGFDKNPVVVVDGRYNKPISEVKPFGSIEFTSRANMRDVLLDTYQRLISTSPVLTGRYQKSHVVFWNGTQIATDLNGLTAWLDKSPDFQDRDLIRFVDIQPYARRLERLGVTAGRQQSRKASARDKKDPSRKVIAPNGVYFLTQRAIRRKYKRNSVIKFGFLSGSQIGLLQVFKSGGTGKRRSKNKAPRTYLYPTITISVAENGIV